MVEFSWQGFLFCCSVIFVCRSLQCSHSLHFFNPHAAATTLSMNMMTCQTQAQRRRRRNTNIEESLGLMRAVIQMKRRKRSVIICWFCRGSTKNPPKHTQKNKHKQKQRERERERESHQNGLKRKREREKLGQ